VELKVLFSPEHGIRGTLDEKVTDSHDDETFGDQPPGQSL